MKLLMKLLRIFRCAPSYCVITCELFTRFGTYKYACPIDVLDHNYEQRMIKYIILRHHLNKTDLHGVTFTKSYDL